MGLFGCDDISSRPCGLLYVLYHGDKSKTHRGIYLDQYIKVTANALCILSKGTEDEGATYLWILALYCVANYLCRLCESSNHLRHPPKSMYNQ